MTSHQGYQEDCHGLDTKRQKYTESITGLKYTKGFLQASSARKEPLKLKRVTLGDRTTYRTLSPEIPCQSSFHQLLHNHPHLSSGASTIGQKWLEYKGLSPTPLAIKKKKIA
jgi:hypothetical protein